MPSTLVPDTVAFSKGINENSLPYSSILVILLAHVYQKQWNGSFQLWNSLSRPHLYSALCRFHSPSYHPPNRVLFISYLNNQFDRFKKSFVSRFRHPNILELAAYFTESEKFCLVYPYMRNGSLFDRLQCVVSHINHSAWYSDPLSPGGAAETFWENQEANMCSCEGTPTVGFPRK